MKDKLLEVYHHRRQQYLNREETDLKILQGLLSDLSKVLESEEVKSTEEKPWYPDESGEWKETSQIDFETAKKVLQGRKIEVLVDYERSKLKDYIMTVQSFEDWCGYFKGWGNRVAYKIVKE